MGVLGLTPFLQKSFPEVVKQLPDRLRGLAGKKIVIDGTLITQRLHFAQVPHNYRHVLGWYKIVKELQDSGVSAICVFDGKERSAAKSREAERRREVKRLALARGSIELDRVKRLGRLEEVLDRFQKLDVIQKGRVSERFQRISTEPIPASTDISDTEPLELADITPQPSELIPPPPFPSAVPCPSPTLSTPSDPDVDPALPQDVVPKAPIYGPHTSGEDESDSAPAVQTPPPDQPSKSIPPPPSSPSFPLAASRSSDTSPSISPLDRPFPSPIPDIHRVVDAEVPSSIADTTLDSLALLYFDFRDSVRKLASLTPVTPDASLSTDVEQQEARVEYSMTKSQIQLTSDEAKLWEELTLPGFDATSESQGEKLAALSYRADVMSQSYQRRTTPPTTQTYDESKELLRAMGVPCIETKGTYEAEALASSLVINGLADYVVSEDTDVIVYEAPLIRNITNSNGPLMMLSGAEIRTALQLDRQSFIDFALLLGTDFSQRIKNVGPARALKFIRQHKSIERVIEAETKYTPRVPAPAYLAEVELARMVFQNLPPLPEAESLQQDKDDEGLPVVLQRFGLGKLLMSEDGWDSEEALQGNYFSDDPSAL
ncbi:PIN domain-like protein [Mycena crocata]|nr:PIN domain-like protein [Mycena crocata]